MPCVTCRECSATADGPTAAGRPARGRNRPAASRRATCRQRAARSGWPRSRRQHTSWPAAGRCGLRSGTAILAGACCPSCTRRPRRRARLDAGRPGARSAPDRSRTSRPAGPAGRGPGMRPLEDVEPLGRQVGHPVAVVEQLAGNGRPRGVQTGLIQRACSPAPTRNRDRSTTRGRGGNSSRAVRGADAARRRCRARRAWRPTGRTTRRRNACSATRSSPAGTRRGRPPGGPASGRRGRPRFASCRGRAAGVADGVVLVAVVDVHLPGGVPVHRPSILNTLVAPVVGDARRPGVRRCSRAPGWVMSRQVPPQRASNGLPSGPVANQSWCSLKNGSYERAGERHEPDARRQAQPP